METFLNYQHKISYSKKMEDKDMSNKISVSFKSTKKEQEIYKYFNALEETGVEIKKILLSWYEANIKKVDQTEFRIEV